MRKALMVGAVGCRCQAFLNMSPGQTMKLSITSPYNFCPITLHQKITLRGEHTRLRRYLRHRLVVVTSPPLSVLVDSLHAAPPAPRSSSQLNKPHCLTDALRHWPVCVSRMGAGGADLRS